MSNDSGDITYVRSSYHRNRKIRFKDRHVQTDGQGNIISRPLVRGLSCFGNPVEWYRGLIDEEYRILTKAGEVRNPFGCAGCAVRPICARVMLERIRSDDELAARHALWEQASASLTGIASYNNAAWLAFVERCDALSWTDANDQAIKADNVGRAKKAKQERSKKASAKRRRRPIGEDVANSLSAERDRREAQLTALRDQPGARRYVSKLPADGAKFTADVWLAEQRLKLMGVKRSAVNVAREVAGRDDVTAAYQNRVRAARDRCVSLEDDGVWLPYSHPATDIGTGMLVTHDFTP